MIYLSLSLIPLQVREAWDAEKARLWVRYGCERTPDTEDALVMYTLALGKKVVMCSDAPGKPFEVEFEDHETEALILMKLRG